MPAAASDWARPFLLQAREDLRAADQLVGKGCPSMLCMLIQMVFEKLAKAALAHNGTLLTTSHRTAERFFLLLVRDPAMPASLSASPRVVSFVNQLEGANPAVAPRGMPILEYPWEESATASVKYPARHLHLAQQVEDPRNRIALDCLKFAHQLANHLDSLIP